MAAKQNGTATKSKNVKAARQEAFLENLAQHGIITKACKETGVPRTDVYRWKEHDDSFLIRFNQAIEAAKDEIRAEIYRRAKEGWDEDVYQLGKFAGTVHKYSDTLLIFHAKALMSEYRDKQQIDLDVKANVHNTSSLREQLRALPTEQLDQIEQWLLSAKEGA